MGISSSRQNLELAWPTLRGTSQRLFQVALLSFDRSQPSYSSFRRINDFVLMFSLILADNIREAIRSCKTAFSDGGFEVDICRLSRNSSACCLMYFSGMSVGFSASSVLDFFVRAEVLVGALGALRFFPFGGISVRLEAKSSCLQSWIKGIRR
jgi:hypothetical protein